MVSWPLLCMIFVGIVLYQSVVYRDLPGMEERAVDAMFILIPLVFFAIGMAIRHRVLKERGCATVFTTATVVSRGRRFRVGKRSFFPEYEFQVGGKLYRVTSPVGYGVCYVAEGRKVELCYMPDNPRLFYVPIMQKHDNRSAILLCGIGVLFPLVGLFAPLIRLLFSFLG